MSDKYLGENAANSDTKMRRTPIPESNLDCYHKCVREETVDHINFKSEEQSSKS